MGYNDTELKTNILSEEGILTTYRDASELYVDLTYVAYNYSDVEVYNRKIRELIGTDLSLNKEYNIFNNVLSTDYDASSELDRNKHELKFDSDNNLTKIVRKIPDRKVSNHLEINYEGIGAYGGLVESYNLEGYNYIVEQNRAISGHLLTSRGFVTTDYWDDTTFENVMTNLDDILYSANHYVELDYSDPLSMLNNTLEVNGLYGTSGWYNIPAHETEVIYNTFSYSFDKDEFILTKYNPDYPLVNKFYLGLDGPLAFNMNMLGDQPWVEYIKITNLNKTEIKNWYIMYYGVTINGAYNPNKIHHVDFTDRDKKTLKTFTYIYNNSGVITSMQEN